MSEPHLSERIYYLDGITNTKESKVHLGKPPGLKWIIIGMKLLSKISSRLTAKLVLQAFVKPRNRPQHKISDQLLEEAKLLFIALGDKQVATFKWEGGSKKALLLHGWESRSTAMRSLVPELRKYGYTVIGLDAPAHGLSSGQKTNVVEYSDCILAAWKEFGEFDLVLTHSFGGLAISYAFANKSLPGLKTIVMFAQPASTRLALGNFVKLLELNDNVYRQLDEMIFNLSGFTTDQMSVEYFMKDVNSVNGLLFHDQDDNLVPISVAEQVVKSWPTSKLYVTHNNGHFRLIKSPLVLKVLNDYMQKQ